MSILDNYNSICDTAKEAAVKCGRDPESLRVMAVSKTQPFLKVKEAYDAGIRLFGENRVFEGVEKFTELGASDCEVHLIGHLQSNKAKQAVYFNCIQSVDKIKTVNAIDKYIDVANTINIFLEVNTSMESSKAGVHSYDQLKELTEHILVKENIKISGLMTIAPFTNNEKDIRRSFASLRTMAENLTSDFTRIGKLELSMGMSNDYEYAIMEGSTLIRVGTSIFGSRDYSK